MIYYLVQVDKNTQDILEYDACTGVLAGNYPPRKVHQFNPHHGPLPSNYISMKLGYEILEVSSDE
jgi:hypothetical protein